MIRRVRREVWKEIPGYEGYYSVSSFGRVRRDKAYNGLYSGGILKTSLRDGYPALALNKESKARNYTVHVLVALAFLGPRPEGKEVRHLDGDRANPCLYNLAYGTHGENAEDMRLHGMTKVGSRNPAAVLNEDKVRQLRESRRDGLSFTELGRLFGVSRVAATLAALGKTWKHVI